MKRLERSNFRSNQYLYQSGEGFLNVPFTTAISAAWEPGRTWNMVTNVFDEINIEGRQRLGVYQEEYNQAVESLNDEINNIQIGLGPQSKPEEYEQLRQLVYQRSQIYNSYLDRAIAEDIVLTPEQLNQEYADYGYEFTENMSRERAQFVADRQRERQIRDAYIQYGPQGIFAQTAIVGANLASAILDPIEIASAFVPIVGPTKYANMIARYGRYGGRARAGAIEGLAGAVMTEPLYATLSRREQIEYGFTDALFNIGLGSLLGGGIGLIRGRLSKRTPEQIANLDYGPRISRDVLQDDANIAIRQSITKDIVRMPEKAIDIRKLVEFHETNGIRFVADTDLPTTIKQELNPRYILSDKKRYKTYKRLSYAQMQANKIGGQVVPFFNNRFIVVKDIPGDIVRQEDGLPLFFKRQEDAQAILTKNNNTFKDIDTDEDIARIIPVNTSKGKLYAIGLRISEQDADLIARQPLPQGIDFKKGVNLKQKAILRTGDEAKLSNVLYGQDAEKVIADEMLEYVETDAPDRIVENIRKDYGPSSIAQDLETQIQNIENNFDVIYKTSRASQFSGTGYRELVDKYKATLDEIDAFQNALPNILSIAQDGILRNSETVLDDMIAVKPNARTDIKNIYEKLKQAFEEKNSIKDLEDESIKIATQGEVNFKTKKRDQLKSLISLDRTISTGIRSYNTTKDAGQFLEYGLVGSRGAVVKGGGESIDNIEKSIALMRYTDLEDSLRANNLFDYFYYLTEPQQATLWDTIHKINRTDPIPRERINVDDNTYNLAVILSDFIEVNRVRLNNAGASIPRFNGYVARKAYNTKSILDSKDDFLNDLQEKLDFDAMNIADEDIVAFSNSTYDAITTGVRKASEDTEIADPLNAFFNSSTNYANTLHKERLLIFKSGLDEYNFNKKYGRIPDFKELLFNDINRSARSEALLTLYGNNPGHVLSNAKNILKKLYRKADPSHNKILLRPAGNVRSLENYLDFVSGTSLVAQNQRAASVGKNIRAWLSASQLGGATISALGDMMAVFAQQKRLGNTALDAFQNTFTRFIDARIARKNRKEFAEFIAIGTDNQLGSFVNRMNMTDQYDGKSAKYLNQFFKFNLLTPWTNSLKTGVSMIIARDVAKQTSKSWLQVPAQMRRILSNYGIDETNWQYARKAVRNIEGKNYFSPQAVDDLPISKELKDDIRIKMINFLDSEADIAVPTPGAYEQVLATGGYRPGSLAGESIRFLMQYKTFPITVYSRVFKGQLYGYSDDLKATATGAVGLAQTIAGMMALGYVSLQSKQIIAGKEFREIDARLFTDTMVQSGALGLYGDFLFNRAVQYGQDPLVALGGPALGTASDMYSFALQPMFGEGFNIDTAQRRAIRLLKGITPYQNLFYTKMATDYLIWHQLHELAEPGYLRRMEKRIEDETGQEYIIKPSDHVRYGGGFK